MLETCAARYPGILPYLPKVERLGLSVATLVASRPAHELNL